MNKPITVLREEFIEKHIELLNTSGLPAFVLIDVLKESMQELRRIAEDQYKKDVAEWKESQNTETDKDVEETE